MFTFWNNWHKRVNVWFVYVHFDVAVHQTINDIRNGALMETIYQFYVWNINIIRRWNTIIVFIIITVKNIKKNCLNDPF